MLDRYFVAGVARDPLNQWGHDPWLVALSVALAVVSSIMAMHLAGLARGASTPLARRVTVASGAAALGGGIWSMHFVGMLAFDLCAQGSFSPGITALSFAPGLLASWAALSVLAKPHARAWDVTLGGMVVGAGIGAMHYLGMAASELAPLLRYDVTGFITSVVFALVMAVTALWVRVGLLRWIGARPWVANVAGGAVMGLAIAGMHYISVAAVRIANPLDLAHFTTESDSVVLAVSIATAAVVLGLVVTIANIGLRHQMLYRQTMANESRLRAVVDTAVDGIVTIDAQGVIQSFNGAAERLLGWRADEVLDRNISMLMPTPHREAHDDYLRNHFETGFTKVIGAGREVEALRKDGSRVPIRLAVGRVEQPGNPLFVGFLVDLSERKALEAERRRGEEQLRSLVGNIPGVAFRCRYQRDWAMLFISDAVEALTGWSAQEFLNGHTSFDRLIHPDDGERVWQEVSAAVQAGRSYHIEYRLLSRAGALVWVSETGRGVAGSAGTAEWLDGVIVNISDSKTRSAEFAGVVRALNRAQAVAEFDLQGRVITANENFLQLMGYTLAEVVGQHHALFCTPEYVRDPAYMALWERLARGELDAGEYERVGKDGREVWIQATYNPILDAQGRATKIIKFATDLSERRAMEQDLRLAKERAEQAAQARATFLANMSHEIRTPMNAIIGFTEALLETTLDATQRRHLGTVHHAARSMLRLLNDILDTAKLEKGAVELELVDFNLRDLSEQILASLRIHAVKKGLELNVDFPDNVPQFWHGDGFRVQQILLNLLGNALKFTQKGGVTLRVRHTGGVLEMAVIDTGIGIDAAGVSRIFDPFAQADASTTRRYGGTGLGTTIARQLAELMGGSIGVKSVVGKGSVFTVRLPLPQADGAEVELAMGDVELPALRVLAVDDVSANLELLQITLGRAGHEVTCASSGAAALEAFAAGRFDLVLMDLQMPEMDGLEVTRQLRVQEMARGHRPTPVIALSASVLEQDRRNARAAGMDGFASKPIEPARLAHEMARVLGLLHSQPAAITQPGVLPSMPMELLPELPLAPPTPPIDWPRGLRVWSQPVFLRQAIERFMQEAWPLVASLKVVAAEGDWQALAQGAHRLRGAAGNLALVRLQSAAEVLERASLQGDAPHARAALGAIVPALEAVREALLQPQGSERAEAAVASAAPPAVNPAQMRDAIDALDHALANFEIAEAPLLRLAAGLPGADAARLQDALDSFDFDAARACLKALRPAYDAPENALP